jgi:signal transduction histidine kinase
MKSVASTVQGESDGKTPGFGYRANSSTANLIGDPAQIKIALLNYATNAIRYTESGSVILRSQLVEDDGKRVVVRFRGAGHGYWNRSRASVSTIFHIRTGR